MSSRATDASTPRSRPPILDELLSAGWSPLLAVVLAGFTLGFFAWYAAIVPRHDDLLSNLGLPLCILGGAAVTVWLWLGYGHYFARRGGITFNRAVRCTHLDPVHPVVHVRYPPR